MRSRGLSAAKSIRACSPEENAISTFSGAFLKSLGEKFGFDGTKPEIAASIRYAAIGYFAVLGRRKSPDNRKQARREYIQLAKNTRKFLKILENANENGIASDMEYVAQMESVANKAPLAALNDNAIQRGISGKYDELIRLLNLLVTAAEHGKENYSAKPGPKIDLALETLVRRAANFWIYELGRKFTIDQHKGSGTTKSFEFIRALASRLNNHISDTEVVTAMRVERENRRKIELASQKARGAPNNSH